MSIAISTEPDELSPAFNTLEYKVTSNRNDRTAFTVTGVSDNGSGKCRYAVSTSPLDAPLVQSGDVILGSGFAETSYNVKQSVTGTNATYIDTDQDFVGDSTGTITRRNDNFKVKATVYKRNSVWTSATSGTDGGFITLTSAVFVNVSVGDYVMLWMDYTTDYKTKYKVRAVNGTTLTIDQTSLTGRVLYCALTDIVGTMYAQSESTLSTSTFDFDVSTLINTHVSADFLTLGGTNVSSTTTQTSILGFMVLFEELYENKDGLYALSTTPSGGNYRQVLNAVNQSTDVQSLARYVLNGSSNIFLSEIPNNTKIHIDQELQLSFVTTERAVIVAYKKYNLSGVAGTTQYLASVTLEDALDTFRRGTIPINKTTVFDSTTSKVEVYVTAGGLTISQRKTFVIDHRCYESDVILEFENRQGGVDSFTYAVTNETKQNVSRSFYKNAGIKGTGYVQSVKRLTLESRNETKAVYEWLEKLYESSNIYLVNSSYTAGRVKVNLVDSDYIINSQELFTSIIEIELQETKLN